MTDGILIWSLYQVTQVAVNVIFWILDVTYFQTEIGLLMFNFVK